MFPSRARGDIDFMVLRMPSLTPHLDLEQVSMRMNEVMKVLTVIAANVSRRSLDAGPRRSLARWCPRPPVRGHRQQRRLQLRFGPARF